MAEIKKQMKFRNTSDMERFFDCPMKKRGYIDLLKQNNEIDIDDEDLE